MQGTRLPDGQSPQNPGEYAWMPYSLWVERPSSFTGEGEWHIVDPTGRIGAIRERAGVASHTWTIEADGSVTFSPSLVMPSGWHGWLRGGVFTS